MREVDVRIKDDEVVTRERSKEKEDDQEDVELRQKWSILQSVFKEFFDNDVITKMGIALIEAWPRGLGIIEKDPGADCKDGWWAFQKKGWIQKKMDHFCRAL